MDENCIYKDIINRVENIIQLSSLFRNISIANRLTNKDVDRITAQTH